MLPFIFFSRVDTHNGGRYPVETQWWIREKMWIFLDTDSSEHVKQILEFSIKTLTRVLNKPIKRRNPGVRNKAPRTCLFEQKAVKTGGGQGRRRGFGVLHASGSKCGSSYFRFSLANPVFPIISIWKLDRNRGALYATFTHFDIWHHNVANLLWIELAVECWREYRYSMCGGSR